MELFRYIKSRHALLCALALALIGCATPYSDPVFDPPDASFPGLKQLVAQEPTDALDLFIVHGMCTVIVRPLPATINRPRA